MIIVFWSPNTQVQGRVTVLEGGVLDAVGPVGLVGDLAVCQRSGRVPDLRLHMVSSSPGQRTGVHREGCGGFSENSWRKEKRMLARVK